MSIHVTTAILKRDLQTVVRKAVMMLLADKASDDGSGIWASKARMADELCMSRRHLQRTIKDFVDEGLVGHIGQRKCAKGFTHEYAIKLDAIEALPLVEYHAEKWGDTESGVTGSHVKGRHGVTSRGDTESPKPSLEPSNEQSNARARESESDHGTDGGYSEGFEQWWQLYPKKVAKQDAFRKYMAALKKGASDETLLEKLQAHCAVWRQRGTAERFIPNPATYLFQGRYDDPVGVGEPQQSAMELDPEQPPPFEIERKGVCDECDAPGYVHLPSCSKHKAPADPFK